MFHNDYQQINIRNGYNNLSFQKKQEKTEKVIIKTYEPNTEEDTFSKESKDSMKKSNKTALAVGAGVLFCSGIALLLNPRFSRKTMTNLKLMRRNLGLQIEKTKNNALKNKFFKSIDKGLGKLHDIAEFSNNANSMKDIWFKNLCTEKHQFNSVKNKTVRKVLQKLDSGFVNIMKKPHEAITRWFDKISIKTVKTNLKKANKEMNQFEAYILKKRELLSPADQIKLDELLAKLKAEREFFTEEALLKRLQRQEAGMKDLQVNVEGKFKRWWDGFSKFEDIKRNGIKNETKRNFDHLNDNFDFWAQDTLMAFRNKLTKESSNATEKLTKKYGSEKGVYQEIIDLFKKTKDINPSEKTALNQRLEHLKKTLLKTNDIETVQYFDKKRDLVLGGAPTDMLSNLGMLGISAALLAAADSKEERQTRTMTGVLPIIGGIGTNLLFTAMLYSGITGLLMGAGSSIVLSKLGSIGNKYLFGNDIDKEIEIKKTNKVPDKQDLKPEVFNA